MRNSAWIFIAFFVIGFLSPGAYAQVNDPENLTYVKAEVTQSGKIRLNSESSLASAEDMSLRLFVPQNDSRQKTSLTKVIGPESYFFTKDGYGNTQIVLIWSNPPLDMDIDYLVETVVEVEAKSSGVSRNFAVTPVIEPSREIIETAYTFGGTEKSALNMFRLNNWVNEYVDYDLSCEREAYPAKWVFENKIGTCDEFSNLLLSMLRTLGYQAWYTAGYAYLGGKQEGGAAFGSHAWVEAYLTGETYGMDPTWAEAPVDATHITFARLPDSNFTEQTSVKSRDVSLRWEKGDTILQLLDYTEEPRIETRLQVLPEDVGGGKNIMILADLEADGCVATNMRVASCVDDNGDSMIGIDKLTSAVAFCDGTRFYWFGETPEIRQGVKYTCPVSVAAGGEINKVRTTISSQPDKDILIRTSVERIVDPGQEMHLGVTLTNSGRKSTDLRVFAILNDEIKEKGTSIAALGNAELEFSFEAPQIPGGYELHVFSDSGDLKKETITVISDRNLKISQISIPKSLVSGTSGLINVTVINSGETASVNVRLRSGESSETKNVMVEGGGSALASFEYQAVSEGSNSIIFSVLDENGAYQDSWTGTILVTRDSSFKENISSMFEDIITAIIEFFRSLFGG